MPYYLGIDLGTTYTAAAAWRDGRAEIASLGTRAPVVPSLVFLREDGSVLVGESAARRAVVEPQRLAREFKRRFGDPTPVMLGGSPYAADALMARLLRWVVDTVTEREGGPPAGIAVSHPANWGQFRQDLLQQTLRLADVDDATTLTEPEAAAIHYASQERVEIGRVVAVYDLGGGTFDAAVFRRSPRGWEILGRPEGVERLGGVDFDQAVFEYVCDEVGEAPLAGLHPADRAAMGALARLRQDCVEAKEALANDDDVSIPVLLPTVQTEVMLTRAQLERMIRPALDDSIGALRRAIRSAGVQNDEVASVLLVGGSSRLPLVAELVHAAVHRPVALDAHPKYGIALGAAIVAAERATGTIVDTEIVPVVPVSPEPVVLAMAASATAAAARVTGGAAATTANGSGAPTVPVAADTTGGRAADEPADTRLAVTGMERHPTEPGSGAQLEEPISTGPTGGGRRAVNVGRDRSAVVLPLPDPVAVPSRGFRPGAVEEPATDADDPPAAGPNAGPRRAAASEVMWRTPGRSSRRSGAALRLARRRPAGSGDQRPRPLVGVVGGAAAVVLMVLAAVALGNGRSGGGAARDEAPDPAAAETPPPAGPSADEAVEPGLEEIPTDEAPPTDEAEDELESDEPETPSDPTDGVSSFFDD